MMREYEPPLSEFRWFFHATIFKVQNKASCPLRCVEMLNFWINIIYTSNALCRDQRELCWWHGSRDKSRRGQNNKQQMNHIVWRTCIRRKWTRKLKNIFYLSSWSYKWFSLLWRTKLSYWACLSGPPIFLSGNFIRTFWTLSGKESEALVVNFLNFHRVELCLRAYERRFVYHASFLFSHVKPVNISRP